LLPAARCRPLPTARRRSLLPAATARPLRPAAAACKVQIQPSSVTEGGGTQLLAKSKSNRPRSEGGGTHLHTFTQSPSGTHRHKLARCHKNWRRATNTDRPRAQIALGHRPPSGIIIRPPSGIINPDTLLIPHSSSDLIFSVPPLSSQSNSSIFSNNPPPLNFKDLTALPF
jgi:hypothetical protein